MFFFLNKKVLNISHVHLTYIILSCVQNEILHFCCYPPDKSLAALRWKLKNRYNARIKTASFLNDGKKPQFWYFMMRPSNEFVIYYLKNRCYLYIVSNIYIPYCKCTLDSSKYSMLVHCVFKIELMYFYFNRIQQK